MQTVGERLRMLRKACGFTLGDVAEKAGISVSFLSDVERGRTLPSMETMEALAEVFDLTIGEALVNVRVRQFAPTH